MSLITLLCMSENWSFERLCYTLTQGNLSHDWQFCLTLDLVFLTNKYLFCVVMTIQALSGIGVWLWLCTGGVGTNSILLVEGQHPL